MTESEVQRAIMRLCKVDGHDSDFNVVGFHVLCDLSRTSKEIE